MQGSGKRGGYELQHWAARVQGRASRATATDSFMGQQYVVMIWELGTPASGTVAMRGGECDGTTWEPPMTSTSRSAVEGGLQGFLQLSARVGLDHNVGAAEKLALDVHLRSTMRDGRARVCREATEGRKAWCTSCARHPRADSSTPAAHSQSRKQPEVASTAQQHLGEGRPLRELLHAWTSAGGRAEAR